MIHPILDWLLTSMEDVKQRSYLAQFLVKLDVPPEMLGDPDISYLYEQYESHIEEFKNIHKESQALKGSGMSVTELRSDISAMEGEKEIVLKKIEKLQRRVSSISLILNYSVEVKDFKKSLFKLNWNLFVLISLSMFFCFRLKI